MMRRSLLALLVLALLAAAVFAAGGAAVGGQGDDVTLTEERRFGDPAAAAGLTVTTDTTVDSRLHWSTTLTLGAEPAWETDFRYTASPERERGTVTPTFYLYAPSNFSVSTDGSIDPGSPEFRTDFGVLAGPVAEAIARAEPGTEQTVSVALADHWEYLPLLCAYTPPAGVEIATEENVAGGYFGLGYDSGLWPDAAEFFRLPVDGCRAEIRVETYEAGGAYGVEFNAVGLPELLTAAVWDGADGIYLAAAAGYQNDDGAYQVDRDAVTPGVYYLPLMRYTDAYGNTLTRVDTDAIRLLWQVPDGGYVQQLDVTGGGTRLLAQGSDTCWVLTPEGTEVQSFPKRQDAYWDAVDDTTAVFLTTDWVEEEAAYPYGSRSAYTVYHAAVWQLEDDGRYACRIDCAVDGAPVGGATSDVETYFDGTRLLVAGYLDGYRDPGFDVLVCDGDGPQYAARFRNSQALDAERGDRIRVDGNLRLGG